MSQDTPGFVDVRDADDKLRFRYDPERDLIELVERGKRQLIDLRAYKPGGRLATQAAGPRELDLPGGRAKKGLHG